MINILLNRELKSFNKLYNHIYVKMSSTKPKFMKKVHKKYSKIQPKSF